MVNIAKKNCFKIKYYQYILSYKLELPEQEWANNISLFYFNNNFF